MSVPAWPIPIHHTKFVMSNAQPMGTLLPQMPMPVTTRYDKDANSRSVSMKAAPKPSHQPIGVFRARTIAAILSVTDPNV